MSTSAITGTSTQNTQIPASTTSGSSALGKNDFLNLLCTQLQNQDPLNPTNDTQFISQLAQFSSLEQMQNMNTNLQSFTQNEPMLQSSSLIGRTITAAGSNGGAQISGKVDSVTFNNGSVVLNIGNQQVPASNVLSIS